MKTDAHPDYHMIKVQMTDGTTVRDPLHLGQGRRHAAAGHRSDGASAWTGGTGKMLDQGGQVARFNKRFGGLTLGKK
jgi:large subunit ribosomal protein L31